MWMRVYGCNNMTCGDKPGFFDYVRNKKFDKYQFSSSNGKISYKKNENKIIE